MGFTTCSGGSNCSGLSSSSSSTTCSSSSSPISSHSSMPTDQMVKVEMEAAEALADLAFSAMRESGALPSDRKWGTKGKRARKEVKSESPTPDSRNNSLLKRSDPNHGVVEDRAVVSQRQSEEGCQNTLSKPANLVWKLTKKMVKDDMEVESLKPSPASPTTYPLFGCRRSRRHLTEAEKEEKRIRRVLANRESARQTIRRRQALCEELTKRAADLAWENEKLKREKELALKEFHSLETTNKHLKEQMAQAVKPKAEEVPGNKRSPHFQRPHLSSNYPLFLYSHPAFASCFWPSAVQSSTPCQPGHDLQNLLVIPSRFPFPANNSVCVSETSHEQESFTNINGHRTPFCVLPCSWFLPHHDHSNQLNSRISISMENNNVEKISLNSQSSAYSSKVVAHEETQHSSFLSSVEAKTEVPNSNEALNSKDHHRTHSAVGVVLDGLDGAEVRKMLSPVKLECIEPTSSVKENRSEGDHSPSSRACHEPEILYSKKIIDALAAAEARKRRRELTKLKNLHARQCRAQS